MTFPDDSANVHAEWTRLRSSIRLYSWAQVAFLTILVGIIHALPIMGNSWSSCLVRETGATSWSCVVFFHLYELPLAALFIHHIIVGLRPLTRASLPYYCFLTLFQLVMLFVFLTFESTPLIQLLQRQGPTWEIVLLFGGCTGMVVNSLLGFHTVFRRILPVYLAGQVSPEHGAA